MVYVAPPTVRRVTQLKDDRVRIEGWNVAFMPAQSPFFRPEQSVYFIRSLPCLNPVVVPGELDPQFAAVECTPQEPVLQAQQFAGTVVVSVGVSQIFRDPQIQTPSSISSTTNVPWQAVMNMTSSGSSATVNSGGVAGITVGVTILAFILVGALVWFIIHRRQANQNSAGIPTRTNPLFDRRTSTQQGPVTNPLAITSASAGAGAAGAPPTSRSTTEMASLPGSTQIRTVERP